jgi:hypothetical protein
MPDLEFDLKGSLKVTDDIISGKVICDFLFVFNSNYSPSCCHFQDISNLKFPPYLLTLGQISVTCCDLSFDL